MNKNTKLWISAAFGLACLWRLAPLLSGDKPHLATALILIIVSGAVIAEDSRRLWLALVVSVMGLALYAARFLGILPRIGLGTAAWTSQESIDMAMMLAAALVVLVVMVSSRRNGVEAQG